MRWPFRKNEYAWERACKPEMIEGFSVCFGDLPIRCYDFDGKRLKGYNRIHGSRDGWRTFPMGFFSEKSIELTAGQIENIRAMLALIPYGELKSEEHIIELLDSGAEGFSAGRMLECRLAGGRVFRYLPGSGMHPLVMMLFHSLSLACPLPEWKPEEETRQSDVSEPRATMMLAACPECGKRVIYPAKYCGMCRAEFTKYKDIMTFTKDMDQETIFTCMKCGQMGPAYYKYCPACGNAQRG